MLCVPVSHNGLLVVHGQMQFGELCIAEILLSNKYFFKQHQHLLVS